LIYIGFKKYKNIYKLVPIIETIIKSKQDKIIELFFEEPTRQWHFEEILKEANITRSKAGSWLKKLVKEKIIKKVKEKGKMPHYIGNCKLPEYKNKKRIFALNRLYESGLLNHLYSLKRSRTVILFGSLSRSDWHKKSDINIFIYGDEEGLKIMTYELRLHRNIQLFICKNKDELAKLGKGLIKNIIKGDIIKGDIDFIKVGLNA